jgi:hypothetical protein
VPIRSSVPNDPLSGPIGTQDAIGTEFPAWFLAERRGANIAKRRRYRSSIPA